MPLSPAVVTVAAVQVRSTFGDVCGNSGRLAAWVHRAADAGAQLVVAPECAIPGYASDDLRQIWHDTERPIHPWFAARDVLAVAEPVPGPTTDRFANLARSRSVYLLIGMIERDGSHAYNTAVLLSPAGELVAKHRKRWPWPAVEPAWARPGDLPPVMCETPFGSVGIAICYDVHRVRQLYRPGQLWSLLFPAAWVDVEPPTAYFDRRSPRLATHLGCNLIFANRCMTPGTRWLGSGESAIYRADGSVAARSPEQFEEGLVVAAIPVSAQVDQRP
jgi:predicted amidohydrolase